jgi:hypothetical protein
MAQNAHFDVPPMRCAGEGLVMTHFGSAVTLKGQGQRPASWQVEAAAIVR